MVKFFLRWLINAVGLYVAVYFVPGVTAQNPNPLSFIWLALIFGLLNAFLRPLLNLLALPLTCLTLGLFTLIINTFMFWLAGVIGTNFGVGFSVDGFLPAFLGGIVVSLVSVVLSLIFKEELKSRH
jgi:putative membrane protein